MKFGYWLPVFGGWLRNVEHENMNASWEYVRKLALRSEELGYDTTLVAELNLNDIKGESAPSLDAWSTAAALAAVTRKIEIMIAVRPTFHSPALLAKQAANIDHISNGRLTLNVVSSWWQDEARQYGVHFEQHDDRYARTSEWLHVVDHLWKEDGFSYQGKYYRVENTILQPKPLSKPRPFIYAGGESEAAKELIAQKCDGYVMHGDPPEVIALRIQDMRARRERLGLPPMKFGVAKRRSGALPMSAPQQKGTTTTSNGWPVRNSKNAYRWRSTRCRTGACEQDLPAHPPTWPTVLPHFRKSGWIFSYYSVARS